MRGRLAVVLLLAVGCELFTPKIHVVVRNGSRGDVDEVSVRFAGHDMNLGIIPPGAHKSYGPLVTELPSDAAVSWVTTDGKSHSQQVPVKSRIAQDGSGDVIFTIIAADRVDVSFKQRQ